MRPQSSRKKTKVCTKKPRGVGVPFELAMVMKDPNADCVTR